MALGLETKKEKLHSLKWKAEDRLCLRASDPFRTVWPVSQQVDRERGGSAHEFCQALHRSLDRNRTFAGIATAEVEAPKQHSKKRVLQDDSDGSPRRGSLDQPSSHERGARADCKASRFLKRISKLSSATRFKTCISFFYRLEIVHVRWRAEGPALRPWRSFVQRV